MPRKICRHCDPIASHPWHFSDRAGNFWFPLKRFLTPARQRLENKFPKLFFRLHKIFLYNLFRALLVVHVLKEADIADNDETVSNRTLVIAKEAAKRGIAVKSFKFLGKETTNFFSIKIKNKKIFFEVLPTEEIAKIAKIDFDDKYEFKLILQSANFPRAEGERFSKIEPALAYANKLGFKNLLKFIL